MVSLQYSTSFVHFITNSFISFSLLPELLLELLRPGVPLFEPRLEVGRPPLAGRGLQRQRLHLRAQIGLVPGRGVARRQGELQVCKKSIF